jgi:hypothetical protein
MLKFRKSVQPLGLRPELLLALISVDGYFREASQDWYIIAGSEGAHTPSSPHYSGSAIQIDVIEADEDDFFGIAADLTDILPSDFTVTAEISYITLEYSPRKGVNR